MYDRDLFFFFLFFKDGFCGLFNSTDIATNNRPKKKKQFTNIAKSFKRCDTFVRFTNIEELGDNIQTEKGQQLELDL